MANERLDDKQTSEIREIKRRYWAQDGIGKKYQYYAHMRDAVTRVKNLCEIQFVCRHILGERVLDAGAGTGRFTLPLQQVGVGVVALDISLEMMREGARRATLTDAAFRAVAGDIERLPFDDGIFDSLVSITVLRHFPGWRGIFKEYLRVVRPGGRLIFDMGSGEQRAFMKQRGLLTEEEALAYDPLGYDAALTIKEVKALAEEHGLSIVTITPHDFFNENMLLKRLLGGKREQFFAALGLVLKEDAAAALYEVLARRFLAVISPAVTSHVLIVLDKVPQSGSGFQPSYRGVNRGPGTGTLEEQLAGLFESILGLRFKSHVREAQRQMNEPAAQRFFDFCREEVLPLLPLDALCWETH